MLLAFGILLVLVLVGVLRYYYQHEAIPSSPEIGLEALKALKTRHEVHSAFVKLIDDEGAGSWPPRSTHDQFPPALRPYHEIYAILAPMLATANPSLDDDYNIVRCREFRSRMRALLSEKIDMYAARGALEAVESGNWDSFSRDAYNGFYSCIACLRHAFRWATNPVVKVAQEEKQLDFPEELDMAWSYIQRRFDITSPSGNIMANAVCNFDLEGNLVYSVNDGMSAAVLNTELAWCRIFYDSELMAIPIYCAMIQAIIDFQRGNKKSCLAQVQTAFLHLRKVMQNLYEKMSDPHVSRAIWVRHVSGIHSWGLSLKSDDPPVEYGGLSGSQILLFVAVDAFLGIDRYHSDEEMRMHISQRMRDVASALGKHSFRRHLSEKSEEDVAIGKALDQLVKQLRSFRAMHKVRAVRYLSAPAPERVPMTAALSVLPGEGEKVAAVDSYASIEGMLIKRLNQTI